MPALRLELRVLFLLLFASASALAQEPATPARPQQPAAITITASATERGLRFAAVGPVTKTRLEVYDTAGARVFDSDFLPGNVRDWAAPEQGDDLDGAYTCVLTARDLAGRFSVKQAEVVVEGGRAALSLGKAEPSGGVGASGSEAEGAATLTTHDGRDGAVTATSGDLTLRTGDVLTGRDKEQMRVTSEGRVGIGTDKPEATLDVAGEVRAREGFRFSDGSRLTISDAGALVRLSADGTPLPGWGERPDSQASALADTLIDGDLIFTNPGVANYGRDIRLTDNLGGMRIFGAPSLSASPAGAAIQFFGNGHTAFPGQAYVDAGAHNSAAVIFRSALTGGTITERMRVTSAGDVGIGTNDPQAKLHVSGNVNFTGLRTEANATSPNVVGGHSGNAVTAGVVGAIIGGGGSPTGGNPGGISPSPNRVTDDYGTVGGGVGNRAGNSDSTLNNADHATVSGGRFNTASGLTSTVGGGYLNTASGITSIVGGGQFHTASGYGSTIGGGLGNITSGQYSTVPGGLQNQVDGEFSLAAGKRAKAEHHGSFVWSDSTTGLPNFFTSTGDNQFLINATGGVGIGTNSPGERLHVGGGGILLDNNQGLFMKHTDGNKKRVLIGDSSNILRLGSGSPAGFDEIRFDVNTSGEAMTIKGSGNVGVGTTAPLGKLQVVTAADNNPSAVAAWDSRHFVIGGPASGGGIGLSYDQTNNVGYISSLSPNVLWRNLVLQSGGGNVGVGTATPARKLHVSDAMRLQPIASPPASPASGDLYFDSSEALCVYVSGAWAKLAGAGTCQ